MKLIELNNALFTVQISREEIADLRDAFSDVEEPAPVVRKIDSLKNWADSETIQLTLPELTQLYEALTDCYGSLKLGPELAKIMATELDGRLADRADVYGLLDEACDETGSIRSSCSYPRLLPYSMTWRGWSGNEGRDSERADDQGDARLP